MQQISLQLFIDRKTAGLEPHEGANGFGDAFLAAINCALRNNGQLTVIATNDTVSATVYSEVQLEAGAPALPSGPIYVAPPPEATQDAPVEIPRAELHTPAVLQAFNPADDPRAKPKLGAFSKAKIDAAARRKVAGDLSKLFGGSAKIATTDRYGGLESAPPVKVKAKANGKPVPIAPYSPRSDDIARRKVVTDADRKRDYFGNGNELREMPEEMRKLPLREIPIGASPLPLKVVNLVTKWRPTATLGDLAAMDDRGLRHIPGMGAHRRAIVRQVIAQVEAR